MERFLGIAAEAAGLPCVALVHCPYPLPAPGSPPLFSGFSRARGRTGALRDIPLKNIASRLLDRGLPLINDARAEQALAPLRHWSEQLLAAEAVLVLSVAELDFSSRAQLQANVRYVGAAFEPYQKQWTPPWPEQNDDPLILISLSTSYMNQAALAQRILDAIDGLPIRALLTTGPAISANALQLPANTRAVGYVPHRQVLPHASLVISHCGWQTINAALADGVPIICIPDGRDQPDNAARVIAAGAGIRASKHCRPRRLRTLIGEALADDSLRAGANAIATALARQDGATAVTDELERLCGGRLGR
ncbi:MAG: glycosyltransferase [Solirubrobacteraceae bacterium]